jgi:hypothetical protein
MAKTYKEWAEEHATTQAEEQRKGNEEVRAQLEKDALDFGPAGPETEEETIERANLVRRTMIFGDIDTTAGASAGGTDAPVTDNEEATRASAEVDAKAAEGDEEAQDLSNDQGRRQVSISSDLAESAEEASAGAEAREGAEGEGDVAPAAMDEGHAAQQSASQKVEAIQQADSPEEVDELLGDDDRVTVKRAADKRKSELES